MKSGRGNLAAIRETGPGTRLGLALLAGAAFALVLLFSGAGERFDHILYDLTARGSAAADTRLRGNSRDRQPVELIYIDQYSLSWVEKNLGIAWPWPRELYGVISSFCSKAKAQVFDILFTETSSYGPDDDVRFAAAMDKAGNVVIAEAVDARSGKQLKPLSAKNVGYGSVKGLVDPDGVLRKYGFWFESGKEKRPSLGFAALIKGGDASGSLPADSRVFLRFSGVSPSFPARNAAEILASALAGEGQKEAGLSPEEYAGKYVFIGFSAPGLLDRQAVPTDPAMPGAEIHATFVANYLGGRLIRPLAGWAEILLVFLFVFAASWMSIYLKKPVALTAGAISILLVPAASGFMLYRAGFAVSQGLELSAGLFSYLVGIVLSYVSEGRNRAFLRRSFSQYLAPSVIDTIIKNPKLLRLGGEERIITVLFTDIQGFTSISESLRPQQLAVFMNTYLSLLTEVILSEGGTVDKYVGDAVVAFWNAPLDQGDHASRAVRAALLCQRALAGAESVFASIGAPVPATRIGVHTGLAIVGNMGSPSRFNYTALGDVVNTASRLEGANKVIGTATLVSSDTVTACIGQAGDVDSSEAISGDLKFRLLGKVGVSGKKIPIEVWEPCFGGEAYNMVQPWTGEKDCRNI